MNRPTPCSLSRFAKRVSSGTSILSLLLIGLNMSAIDPANAAIYKCISGSGSVTYSGRECPEQDTTARVIADSGIGSSGPGRTPAAARPAPNPDELLRQKQRREAELETQVDDSKPSAD